MLRFLFLLGGVLLTGAFLMNTFDLAPAGIEVPNFETEILGIPFGKFFVLGAGCGLLAAWLTNSVGVPIELRNLRAPLIIALIFVLLTPASADGVIGVNIALLFAWLMERIFSTSVKPAGDTGK